MANPYGNSLGGHIRAITDHFHAGQFVAPSGAGGVQLSTGDGSWTEGDKEDIIAADAKNTMYDIHFANVEAASATDTYELIFYTGAVASEVEWARTRFTKSAVLDTQHGLRVQGPPIDANERFSASCMSDSAGIDTVTISVEGHPYFT